MDEQVSTGYLLENTSQAQRLQDGSRNTVTTTTTERDTVGPEGDGGFARPGGNRIDKQGQQQVQLKQGWQVSLTCFILLEFTLKALHSNTSRSVIRS